MRPKTSVRCSMRLCPLFDHVKAEQIITRILTENPPYGAKIEVKGGHSGRGWCMKELDEWLHNAIHKAGEAFYG